jgi:hypothetical protein
VPRVLFKPILFVALAACSEVPIEPIGGLPGCSEIPTAGEWTNITPRELAGGESPGYVTAVELGPPGTFYLGTAQRGLLRSEDCGATWSRVNSGRNSEALSGWIWNLVSSPSNRELVYAASLGSGDEGLYRSNDGGVNWDPLFPAGGSVWTAVPYGGTINSLVLDPDDARHLLVNFHADCGPSAPNGGCLGESFDGGDSWTLLPGPQSGWSSGARVYLAGRDTLLFSSLDVLYLSTDRTQWVQVSADARYPLYRSSSGLFYLGGAFGSHTSVDGRAWTATDVGVSGIAGDGERMYTSWWTTPFGEIGFLERAESDGGTWTAMKSPAVAQLSSNMAYDLTNHVILSAHREAGLWRARTR